MKSRLKCFGSVGHRVGAKRAKMQRVGGQRQEVYERGIPEESDKFAWAQGGSEAKFLGRSARVVGTNPAPWEASRRDVGCGVLEKENDRHVHVRGPRIEHQASKSHVKRCVRRGRFRSDSRAIQGRFGLFGAIRHRWRLCFRAIRA